MFKIIAAHSTAARNTTVLFVKRRPQENQETITNFDDRFEKTRS